MEDTRAERAKGMTEETTTISSRDRQIRYIIIYKKTELCVSLVLLPLFTLVLVHFVIVRDVLHLFLDLVLGTIVEFL